MFGHLDKGVFMEVCRSIETIQVNKKYTGMMTN